MPSEYDISLNIRNNRNYAQTFNGMGGSVNPLDTSNATTEYRYNITTFNFSDENSITIYYKAVGTTNFSSFTADLTSQTPEGLVFALNGLGIGFFNTYVELGQTYLGTYNENYIFGSLDVYNSSIPTTTTTSTSTTTTTIFVPTTTTTSTTSTTTSLAPTTSTTSTTTSLAPTTTTTTTLAPTTSTTTTTTSLAPTTTTTTSTTTTTTTEAATTTSTTTSTTTEAATTTSTTTTTTTEAATTTSTTTTTTTEAATTSTTTSTTTEAATTTSTTSTTTTLEPTTTTTSTSTTTTTLEPTTTTTSTSTTTTTLEPTTTTTSTSTTTTTLEPTTTTSTTSTTTTIPPVTLSLTPGCAGGEGSGTILANNFNGGTGSFEYISISATSEAEALTNLDNPATRTFINGATEYTFTTLANSTYYVAIMDFSGNKGANSTSVLCVNTTTTTTSTTSTTSTSTSTTSTTTTLPPVTLSLTPGCSGGPGLGTILANNFNGGTGSFEYISISATSGAEALTNLDNPATRTFINGATEYTFTTLANSTYYVAIMDFSGNKGVNNTNVLCTTTTTSTTTTTTTAAPVAYTIDSGANGTPFGACTGSVPTSVVYAEPGNTVPIVGLILYDNQNLTTPFVGSTGWRKLVNPSSVAYAAEVNASGEITNYVTCASQTTTTTSTTTSTTTLPGIAFGVSINTKYGTEFLACGGTVTGQRYQNPDYGNTPTTEAQIYTDSTLQTTWTPSAGAGLYLFQFGGSTKWAVFVDETGIVGAVTACSGVTTTTTSTTSTTSTTTTIPIYTYLGNTNPTYSTLLAACQNYATIRPYYSTKSNLNLIGPTDIIYDSYPGTPTNGGNLWVALTSGGVDPKLGFQIGTDGAVITSGGNCVNATTTTTTTTTSTTTTTTTEPATTSTTTTTTTLAPTLANIDIATNNSLDIAISISGINVNGVAVTNVTGVDPNTPGNGGGCQTTEIGTYVVSIPYSASTGGQSISLVDSDSVPQCQGTISGSDTLIFTGVVINTSQPVTITANEGACP